MQKVYKEVRYISVMLDRNDKLMDGSGRVVKRRDGRAIERVKEIKIEKEIGRETEKQR